MLDAAELIELAVFQRHVEGLKVCLNKVDTVYNDETSIIDYFGRNLKQGDTKCLMRLNL